MWIQKGSAKKLKVYIFYQGDVIINSEHLIENVVKIVMAANKNDLVTLESAR